MSTEDNKAALRRFVEEGWNQGQVAVLDDRFQSHSQPVGALVTKVGPVLRLSGMDKPGFAESGESLL